MITINVQAAVGMGVRQRVIVPALIMQDKPILVVAKNQIVLETNYPEIQHECKMSLPRFLILMQTRAVPPDLLILIDELPLGDWDHVEPWLKALDNEVWTINGRR